MHPINKAARLAGAIYLLEVLVGPFRLIYIPTVLIVTGNATATANNIATHQSLFRFGILSDLLTATFGLFASLALYLLFKEVDRNLAALMVILAGIMVTPIYFINTLNDFAALMLARGADFLSVIDKSQRDALAMLFVGLHHQGIVINEIFWGLWLLPLAALVIKSGFLPRFLGVWLILNGLAYLVNSFMALLLPQYEDMVSNVTFPALTGEVAFVLWLVIMGARVRPAAVSAS